MTQQITQAKDLLALDTPLGKDKLVLTTLKASEAVSQLYSCEMGLFSKDNNISFKDLLGKQVCVKIRQPNQSKPRYINGFISRFYLGDTDMRRGRFYRAEVVPWLWFLQHSSDCQIFQGKTALQIIEDVFKQFGFNDYKTSAVSGSLPVRDYCVQYNETAFNFVTRLMEEEGIFYYFQHEQDKHTLHLANSSAAYQNCDEEVFYSAATPQRWHIDNWQRTYSFCSGKYSQKDYNFETPKADLLTSTNSVVKLNRNNQYELFVFPGHYSKKADGDSKTKYRMESEETSHDLISGSSDIALFAPGYRFDLKKHDNSAEQGSYVLTSVTHEVYEDAHISGGSQRQIYRNTFNCMPANVLFRPQKRTPKPSIYGLQTAVVTGPSGEEIYTDKYGRIKLHFHWDRKGKEDEKSSCWVRVAQNLSGKKWGFMFIPRIGQEVTVSFLNGDPDQPLVTGGVYNADLMPPYELPANMTQSGIKMHSTKAGGSEANELRFEDKKDAEEVYLHAQKDFNCVVENDSSYTIKNDETTLIQKNRTETIEEGNEQLTVKKGDRSISVDSGDDSLEVKQGDRTVAVKQGNDLHEVSQGKRTVNVMGDDSKKIKQGNHVVEVSMGNDTLNVKTGNQTTKISLGKSTTEAMQAIELKVAQSSIKIDPTGITIQGMKISINGQIMTEVKAGAMLKLNGAITMIN